MTTSSPARPPTNSPFRCGPVPRRRDWRKLPTNKLTRAERNMRFVERYCRVPEGDLIGKPIRLADFQEDFYYAVYDNTVPTKRALLSMARKNAKTATIATIVIVHVVGPEAVQNSRISSGARSRKQAAEVYNYAAKMVQLSPELRKLIRAVPSNKKLIGLLMNVEYEALAAEGATAHGGSPIVAILDEVGQVKGPKDDFVDAIVTSQGAYENALLIAISTQAPTDGDMFSIWLDDAERSKDPSIVCHLYAAPEDCELDDPVAMKAANPALGLFRSEKDLLEQCKRAVRMPSEEATYRNLGLNQRVQRHNPFVSKSVWTANGGAPDDVFNDGPVYAGLDLAETTDLTSLVLIAPRENVTHVRPFFWLPEQLVEERARRDREPYDAWRREGMLRTTPGASIDFEWLGGEIASLTDGMDVRGLAFDRYRMKLLKPWLERAGVGFPMIDWGQGWVSMSPAVQALEVELLQNRLRHGMHPVLTMCARNAVIWRDPAGNRKLDKSKSNGRIDGMVALAMAVGAAKMNETEAAPVSPWDDPAFSLVAA